MVGTNLKAETVKLMDQRSAIESEMNVIIDRLCQPGSPGLSDNLVDSEGFPRSDIDIIAVLADRRHLSELKNDYKRVTDKIDQNIQLLHAVKPTPKSKYTTTTTTDKSTALDGQMSSVSNGSEPTSLEHFTTTHFAAPADKDVIANIPFAVIDEISDSSPAAEDGLQLGDQILKFGSVESGENVLPRLAQELQKSQGSAIAAAIMRQGVLTSLPVTPRTWQGRGLLGCHFKLL